MLAFKSYAVIPTPDVPLIPSEFIVTAVPTTTDPETVWFPVTPKVVPSKVKFDSPINAFAPVTVATVLFVDPDSDTPPPPPPDAVTVTIPAEIAETSRFVPKLIVPAVPTVEPSCLTTTPEPDAVIPVNPEPSPLNDVAVKIPDTTAPVLVLSLIHI